MIRLEICQNKLNLNYRSKEEDYFSWWLDDLAEKGFIKSALYEPHQYLLSDKVPGLLRKHVYTPDWIIEFTTVPDFMKQFHIVNKMWVVDIKGSFNGARNTSAITFPLNQKWMYQRYGIYVDKIIPKELFENTFTPKRYLKTDGGDRERKINWKIKTL